MQAILHTQYGPPDLPASHSGAIQMLDQSFQSHAGFLPFDPKFAQTLGGSATSNPPTEFLKADQNKEQSTMKRSSLTLVAVTLLAAVGMSLHPLRDRSSPVGIVDRVLY